MDSTLRSGVGACKQKQSAPVLLPLPTVARRLHLGLGRVVALIRSGRLEARLVGGCRWFVPQSALRAYRQRTGDLRRHEPAWDASADGNQQ